VTASTDDDVLTVFSDYVCPFCYLGRAALARYRDAREEPLSVEWHPFDLRARRRGPDGRIAPDADDGKDEAYYAQARENVERLADRYGVEMARTLVTDVDSLPAQVASYRVQAERPERWRAFDDAIFEAVWRDGRDVGDVDVLAGLAAGCDLDPDWVRETVEDGAARGELDRAFDAAQAAGVTGVPTFVYGDRVARGAVPPEHLERLVEG